MKRAGVCIVTALFGVLGCSGPVLCSSAGDDHSGRIGEFMQRLYECGMFNGSVLVARDGEVIYKQDFGFATVELEVENRPDTRFRIGSLTKSFTAVLIVQLVEEGKLKLDDKITTHLPGYPRGTGDLITIEHLLAHTSGVPNTAKDIPGLWTEGSCTRVLLHSP